MFIAHLNLLNANVALVTVIQVFVLLTVSCTQNSNNRVATSHSVTEQESGETASTGQNVDDVSLREALQDDTAAQNPPPASTPTARRQDEDRTYHPARTEMIAKHLRGRDISDPHVLDALARVPRHEFVPARARHLSYVDAPLSIGHDQTISQPYIVALMTQLVNPKPASKALDIGTGSGYQAAVLAELVKTVYSIEIVKPLAEEARVRLPSLGYKNIHVRHGDGYRGWPEQAPFDIIIVAAAPDHVPQPLVDQLAPGGKMVIPVGKYYQNLLLLEKAADGTVVQRNVAPVAFVPMTGEAQK